MIEIVWIHLALKVECVVKLQGTFGDCCLRSIDCSWPPTSAKELYMSTRTPDTLAEAKGNYVDGVDVNDSSVDRVGMRPRTLLSVVTEVDDKTGLLEAATFKEVPIPSLKDNCKNLTNVVRDRVRTFTRCNGSCSCILHEHSLHKIRAPTQSTQRREADGLWHSAHDIGRLTPANPSRRISSSRYV